MKTTILFSYVLLLLTYTVPTSAQTYSDFVRWTDDVEESCARLQEYIEHSATHKQTPLYFFLHGKTAVEVMESLGFVSEHCTVNSNQNYYFLTPADGQELYLLDHSSKPRMFMLGYMQGDNFMSFRDMRDVDLCQKLNEKE